MSEIPAETDTTASIGAVVLTWRDTDQTARCIRELIKSPLLARILVVDNESEGRVRDVLPSDPRIHVIEHQRNIGFAAGINSGIRELLDHADIGSILILNNDAVLPVDSLSRLAAALDQDELLSMVGPRNWTPNGRHLSSGGVINRWTWSVDESCERDDVDFLTWACVLVRISTFKQIGLLDERFFMYFEDVDFGLRMKRASLRFAVVSSAKLIHEVSSSHIRAGTRVTAYSAASFRHFLRLHAGSRQWTGVIRLSARVVRALLLGDMPRARYTVFGWRLGRRAPNPAYAAFEELR